MAKLKYIFVFSSFLLFVCVTTLVFFYFSKNNSDTAYSKVSNDYYPIMRGEENTQKSQLAKGLQQYELGDYAQAISLLNIENNDTAQYFSALSYAYSGNDEMAIILFDELTNNQTFGKKSTQHLAEIALHKNAVHETIAQLENDMKLNFNLIKNL